MEKRKHKKKTKKLQLIIFGLLIIIVGLVAFYMVNKDRVIVKDITEEEYLSYVEEFAITNTTTEMDTYTLLLEQLDLSGFEEVDTDYDLTYEINISQANHDMIMALLKNCSSITDIVILKNPEDGSIVENIIIYYNNLEGDKVVIAYTNVGFERIAFQGWKSVNVITNDLLKSIYREW